MIRIRYTNHSCYRVPRRWTTRVLDLRVGVGGVKIEWRYGGGRNWIRLMQVTTKKMQMVTVGIARSFFPFLFFLFFGVVDRLLVCLSICTCAAPARVRSCEHLGGFGRVGWWGDRIESMSIAVIAIIIVFIIVIVIIIWIVITVVEVWRCAGSTKEINCFRR